MMMRLRSLPLLALCLGLAAQQPAKEPEPVVGEDICLSFNNNTAANHSLLGMRPTNAMRPFQQPAAADRISIAGFGVSDEQGQVRTVAEQQGKVVVIAFWDKGCKGAIKELQELRQFQLMQAREDLVLWPVHQTSWPVAMDFLKRKKAEFDGVKVFRMAIGEHGAHNLGFELQSLPTVLVLDRSGRIAASWEGYSQARLASVLTRVYNEPRPASSGK